MKYITLALCILACGAIHPVAAATAAAPNALRPSGYDVQHHEPDAHRVNRRLHRRGLAASGKARRSQLRTLNRIDRQLTPAGSGVPAPDVGR